MGLISWIKGQYYNHRLNKADKLVKSSNLVEAKDIYTSLLGKQQEAVVHLANMLSENSNSVDSLLANFDEILRLATFVTDENKNGYKAESEKHIRRMETSADSYFATKDYLSAVRLMQSIVTVKNNPTNTDKLHRFKAYELIVSSQNRTDYKDSLNCAVNELKLMSEISSGDVQNLNKEFVDNSRYTRAIYFLLQFVDLFSWTKDCIIKHIIEIISNNDAEKTNIKSISDVCENSSLHFDIAIAIHSVAKENAKKKDYRAAVLYDRYAAEYLSSDNGFNFERCTFIVEEIASRGDAIEVKELMNLAKDLHLSETQISSLTKKILDISISTEEPKAIKICQLFKGNKSFDKVYCNTALRLCEKGKVSDIDKTELLQIIKNISNEENYPDQLGKFVNFINTYDSEFYSSAIKRIIDIKDTSLLKTYWVIKPNVIFFKELILPENTIYADIVNFIVANHVIFLNDQALKDSFCNILSSRFNVEYVLSTAEALIQKKCDVETFYVTTIINHANTRSKEEAIAIINRALSFVVNKDLLKSKKELIRKFIHAGDFVAAEKETRTLDGIDDECLTILAEIYFTIAQRANDTESKLEYLLKVIDICKTSELYDSFANNKNITYSLLSSISLGYYNDGNKEKANQICAAIAHNQSAWLSLFINLSQKELASIGALSQKIKFIEDTISEINTNVYKKLAIDSQDYNNLWLELSKLYVQKTQSQPKDKAIVSLVALRDNINSNCNLNIAQTEGEELTKIIVKLKWTYAVDLEKDHMYEKAIELYDSTVSENVNSYQKRAEMRGIICHLKAHSINQNIEEAISRALNEKSYQALREDIAYRYACLLIEDVRPCEAVNHINKYLPEEKHLLDLCKNIFVKECELKLDEFNGKIKCIQDGTMTAKQALAFLKEIDVYKNSISNHLTDTAAKFSKYKVQVRAYILKCLFDEENYISAYKVLRKMHPNFIENGIAFRNIAVAAIGIIESDCNDDQILREAISIALSAVYSDKLFINSLEYTSWDDKYTFSLEDSLGRTSSEDYDEMPDNVNFDEPVENQNISIKDVQNNLVIRLETAVHEKHINLEEYFRKEKEALDKILDLRLDEKIILSTPGLCEMLETAATSVKEALDYEYNQEYGNQEDVLHTGVLYNLNDEIYQEYQQAINYLNSCKKALDNVNNVRQMQMAFESRYINAIEKYEKLLSQLKGYCSSAINSSISSRMNYKEFLDTYELVCQKLDEISISLSCANYVNGAIVRQLNEHDLAASACIDYMVRIYNLAPSNVRVKENLEGLLLKLVVDCEKDNQLSDRNALAKAQRDLNGKFNSFVEDSRIQAKLSVIIDKVNDGKMKNNKALEEVYEIYRSNSNNDRVCQNLVTLCDMCIMQYVVKDAWGSQGVRTILNALGNNMSSTFRRHAHPLAKTYRDIWSQLPLDTRMLILGLGAPGQSLNDKGLALKAGLNYYKKLGSVTDSGIGGLFG